jgi:hypothetical protein
MDRHSVRAQEVARDLFAGVDAKLKEVLVPSATVSFHLDASDVLLSRAEAERWVKESVDGGFPNVQYYIEHNDTDRVVVNLAAFEDPDSQYHP